jgi:hypothetical protein
MLIQPAWAISFSDVARIVPWVIHSIAYAAITKKIRSMGEADNGKDHLYPSTLPSVPRRVLRLGIFAGGA